MDEFLVSEFFVFHLVRKISEGMSEMKNLVSNVAQQKGWKNIVLHERVACKRPCFSMVLPTKEVLKIVWGGWPLQKCDKFVFLMVGT